MPESFFAKSLLAVRPLEPSLGRWVFRSVGHLLKRRTRQRTAIVSTRPAHAPLPKRSKTNQNDDFPCVVRPRQRCDGRLVSHEVFHYRKSIVGQGGGPSVPKIVSVD